MGSTLSLRHGENMLARMDGTDMTSSSPLPDCPVLLINLDRAEDRLRQAAAQLEALGIRFERLSAVDGRMMSEAELARAAPWDRAAFFKPLSAGELGCYLSHLAALRRIVDAGWPRALVLEDDFVLQPGFSARLREILTAPGPVPPLVKLEGVRHGGLIVRQLPSGSLLLRNRRPPSRTIAQLWSRDGARAFLAKSSRPRRPVDVEIKHWWETGVEVLHVSPPLVVDGDATGAGSTIGPRSPRGLASRFTKAWYRLRFFLRSVTSDWRRRP